MAVLGGMTCASETLIDDRGTKAVRYTLVAYRHLLSHGDEDVALHLLTEALSSIGYTIRETQFPCAHRHSLKREHPADMTPYDL